MRPPAPFFGDQKLLVAIWHNPHPYMATKRGEVMCYHLEGKKKLVPHFPSWATKEFWLPFDGVGVSNGDQNSSIAI